MVSEREIGGWCVSGASRTLGGGGRVAQTKRSADGRYSHSGRPTLTMSAVAAPLEVPASGRWTPSRRQPARQRLLAATSCSARQGSRCSSSDSGPAAAAAGSGGERPPPPPATAAASAQHGSLCASRRQLGAAAIAAASAAAGVLPPILGPRAAQAAAAASPPAAAPGEALREFKVGTDKHCTAFCALRQQEQGRTFFRIFKMPQSIAGRVR